MVPSAIQGPRPTCGPETLKGVSTLPCLTRLGALCVSERQVYASNMALQLICTLPYPVVNCRIQQTQKDKSKGEV